MTHQADIKDRRPLNHLLAAESRYGRLAGVLTTTYQLDANFFETDLLPTVLGLGAWNDRNWASRIQLERSLAMMDAASVLMDAHCYHGRPRSPRIEVVARAGRLGQLLHAKTLLLVHDRAVRLLVGSANLTQSGYRENREVVLPLIATASSPEDCGLVESAVGEMPAALAEWWTPAAAKVQEEALERLRVWKRSPPRDSWFLWSGRGDPLWRRLLALWPKAEAIHRIDIVSPFWSADDSAGPLRELIEGARAAGLTLATGLEVALHTEASPGDRKELRPKLTPSLQAFDGAAIGATVWAHAVDPAVAAEESSNDDLRRRALHAKVVLFHGDAASLAYVGSANFSRRGWGFARVTANIEAGVALLRRGAAARELLTLIPNSAGTPVRLDGKAGSAVAIVEDPPADAAWPTFVVDARLVEAAARNELLLRFTFAPEAVKGSFSITLFEDAAAELIRGTGDEVRPCEDLALTSATLERLLRDEQVTVRWWASSEPREFPINVDLASRHRLPISPDSGRPGEAQLLAYYQGRIAWEDLFPPPPGYEDDAAVSPSAAAPAELSVDTSHIQSYQVREFVQAISGMENDLRQAARSTVAAIKLALTGAVSPVELARSIHGAAVVGKRRPTAASFELAEIAACLRRIPVPDDDAKLRATWLEQSEAAGAQIEAWLDSVRSAHRDVVGDGTLFERYVRIALRESAR